MYGAPGWTKQQDEALIAGYRNPQMTADDIADVLMVTRVSVLARAHKLGLVSCRAVPPKLISLQNAVATFRLPAGAPDQHALIDQGDVDWFMNFPGGWFIHRGRGQPYVYSRTAPNRKLHRLLLNAEDGQLVDHRNRNGLDNRRANLRLADSRQNSWNSGPVAGKKSKYRGVWQHLNGRWTGRFTRPDGRRVSTGAHDTEEQAARAFDALAEEFRGDFAYLNFPGESP